MFILNFEDISHLSSISFVEFKQVNVCWIMYCVEVMAKY